jgi:hypothetical protein
MPVSDIPLVSLLAVYQYYSAAEGVHTAHCHPAALDQSDGDTHGTTVRVERGLRRAHPYGFSLRPCADPGEE